MTFSFSLQLHRTVECRSSKKTLTAASLNRTSTNPFHSMTNRLEVLSISSSPSTDSHVVSSYSYTSFVLDSERETSIQVFAVYRFTLLLNVTVHILIFGYVLLIICDRAVNTNILSVKETLSINTCKT